MRKKKEKQIGYNLINYSTDFAFLTPTVLLWAGLGTGKKEKQERVSESNFKFLFKICF